MKELIQASYKRITPYFYWLSRLTESKARIKSVKISRIKDFSSVLIIAPPTGFFLDKLMELNPNGRNQLLYFSKEMKQIALDRMKKGIKDNCTIDICTIETLPYTDNQFDHVFAYCYFDFLDNEGINIASSEIMRVLKQGGNLLATYLSEPVNLLEKISIYSISKLGFLRDIRVVEVNTILNQNNFMNITITHYSQKCTPVDLIYAEK